MSIGRESSPKHAERPDFRFAHFAIVFVHKSKALSRRYREGVVSARKPEGQDHVNYDCLQFNTKPFLARIP